MAKYLNILLMVSFSSFVSQIYAQDISLKTNLLYGIGTLTPNAGAELSLGRWSTLDISVGYNPWNLKGNKTDNKKFVHWLGEIEYRYWLCEKFNGHFFGIHGLGSQYNISQHHILSLFDAQYRYQGYALGGGVSYGYHLMLDKRWGIEFNIGAGVAFLNHGKYECRTCGEKIGNEKKTYWGPTKAGISLIYIIK